MDEGERSKIIKRMKGCKGKEKRGRRNRSKNKRRWIGRQEERHRCIPAILGEGGGEGAGAAARDNKLSPPSGGLHRAGKHCNTLHGSHLTVSKKSGIPCEGR
jgi:hypothetical protein